MPPPTSPSADVEFVIADVTYGQGDTTTARAQRKQDKYAQLVANLRAQGWTVRGCQHGSGIHEREPHSASNFEPTPELASPLAPVPAPIPPPAFSQAPAPAPAADPVPATAPDHVSTPVPVLVPVNDHVFVLNLGVTGEVYAMTREALLNLGLTRHETHTTLASLHMITLKYVSKILSTRRKLDKLARGVG